MRRIPFALAALLAVAAPAAAQQNRFEPNQTRRTASRIEPGDYKGLFCNEEDWYFVNVPAGQRLEVSARFAHGDGDLELELHDTRGRLLGWSRGSRDEEVLAFAAAEALPVFLRVHNANNQYDLHLGLSPTGYTGRPGVVEDVNGWGSDWYPLEVEAGKQLRIDVSFLHAKGDLDLALRDGEGNELAGSTSQDDDESLTYTAPEDARLLVHVWHVHHSRAAYTLNVRLGEAVPEDLSRVFGKERPPARGQDLIELRNGDTITGTVLNEAFQVATPYTDLTLPAERLAGLDLERSRNDIETLVTVDNNRLSGFIRTPAVRFRLDGLSEAVEIPRERILRVVFGRRGDERAGLERHQYVVLENGDHFSAAVSDASEWVFDMGFTRLPLRLPEVHSIRFDDAGQVTLARLDQSTVKGRLDLPQVTLRLDIVGGDAPGATFSLHPSRLDILYTQEGYIPDNVRPAGGSLSYDFEDGLEDWTPNGTWNTNWLPWPTDGVRGEGCVRACGPNGANYGDNANATLTSPPLSLAGLAAPILRLQVKTRLEQGPDFFIVRASFDGGQTFAELHRVTGATEWTQVAAPLQPGAAEVVVQLGLTSDGSIVNQGVWVDAVEVVDQAEAAGGAEGMIPGMGGR